MFRSAFLLFLISLSQTAVSQDWQLFPFQHLNHYLVVAENNTIHSLRCDSILDRGEFSSHYFPRISGARDVCYWNTREWIWGAGEDFFILDSLQVYPDSVICYFLLENDTVDFVFKPGARPEDSWNISHKLSATASCISGGIQQVFGSPDSVKTFLIPSQAYGDVEFVLSKSYGLIRYIPFKEFFREPPEDELNIAFHELIGFEQDTIPHGFKIPGFSDYFHLSAGDRQLWERKFIEESYEGDWTINYYLDSIISADISSDTVLYRINRQVFGPYGEYKESLSATSLYTRKEYNQLLGSPLNWIATNENDDFPEVFIKKDLRLMIEESDTAVTTSFQSDQCFFEDDMSYCNMICLDKGFYDIEYRFSTDQGLLYYSPPWDQYQLLLGSEIDGRLRGSLEIPVNIDLINRYKPVIYPNPTANLLYIDSDLPVQAYRVYNTLGATVLSGKDSFPIDLSAFPEGSYFIQIFTLKGQSSGSLIQLVKE